MYLLRMVTEPNGETEFWFLLSWLF